MTSPARFPVQPWSVHETRLDLDALAKTESMFALANGHLGLRGNLDEGEPFGLPGTYLNSFYELRPLPHAEAAYGYPESGQTLVNVTNGKIIRLLVDDEPFDLRYGELRSHERELDLRDGVLRRTVEWVSPAGDGVRVKSTRLVSFAQRPDAAILYQVEPLEGPVRVVIQSELVANEPAPARLADPRAAAALDSPLRSEEHSSYENRVVLVHSTKLSKLRLAAAMDHLVDGPEGTETWTETAPDVGRVTIAADLAPGQRLQVVKFLAYGASSQRSLPAVRDLAVAALAEARHTGWSGLLESQRAYLDDFWNRADVEEGTAHPSGGCSRRAARDRRERSHRAGLRRPHLLGHRAVRSARADLHGAAGGSRRPSLAPFHARPRTPASGPARPQGSGVPVAHDSGPGVLRLLAGRHRGVPHRRGHRRRRRPVPECDGR